MFKFSPFKFQVNLGQLDPTRKLCMSTQSYPWRFRVGYRYGDSWVRVNAPWPDFARPTEIFLNKHPRLVTNWASFVRPRIWKSRLPAAVPIKHIPKNTQMNLAINNSSPDGLIPWTLACFCRLCRCLHSRTHESKLEIFIFFKFTLSYAIQMAKQFLANAPYQPNSLIWLLPYYLPNTSTLTHPVMHRNEETIYFLILCSKNETVMSFFQYLFLNELNYILKGKNHVVIIFFYKRQLSINN